METNYWKRSFERQLTRRRLLLTASQASMAGLLYACGGGNSSSGAPTSIAIPTVAASPLQSAKFGGTLKVGWSGASLSSLDPHTGASGAEHQFFFPIFDPLIGYDQKGNLDASISLAQKWEQPDPLTITLHLRSGVKFSDGTSFGADDVKFNVNRVLDPAVNSTPRTDLGAIDSVQVVDPLQVVLKLKTPSAPLLTNFGDRGGQMLSPTAFNKLGKDAFRRAPVGTGPMILKSWVDGDSVNYEKNPNYWRKDAAGNQLPYLQTINALVMPDNTSRAAAFDAGDIDVLTGAANTDVKRLAKDSNAQTVKFIGSGTSIWYINHAFPPMNNLAFRQAFSAALDRESYIKNFLVGDEPICTGFLTPATWAHDDTIQNFNYDIAKAKALLQASGLPSSQWKIRAQPFGVPISDTELFWATSVKDAGITLDWAPAEQNGWQNRVLGGLGGDMSAAMFFSGFSLRVDPDGHMSPLFTQNGAYNSGKAPVPEVEPLLAQARQTYDQNERKQFYSQAQKAAVQNQYSATMSNYSVAYTFARKKVGNFSAFYGGEGKPRYADMWT